MAPENGIKGTNGKAIIQSLKGNSVNRHQVRSGTSKSASASSNWVMISQLCYDIKICPGWVCNWAELTKGSIKDSYNSLILSHTVGWYRCRHRPADSHGFLGAMLISSD